MSAAAPKTLVLDGKVNGCNAVSDEPLEYADAHDCSIIEVPEAQPRVDPADGSDSERIPLVRSVPEDAGSPLPPSVHGSRLNYSTRAQDTCSECCRSPCCYSFQRCMNIFNTPWALPVYFVLINFPVAAGYMGARYMRECAAGESVPLLVFLIGLCGVLCVSSRIVEIMYYWLFPGCPPWSFPVYIYFFTLATMILIILTEMMAILTIHPDFKDITSREYCHPVFYYFTYYGSLGGLFLVVMAFCIFLPRLICLEDLNSGHVTPDSV